MPGVRRRVLPGTRWPNRSTQRNHRERHNLLSPYMLIQRLLPLLVAAQGNVINISSTSAAKELA